MIELNVEKSNADVATNPNSEEQQKEEEEEEDPSCIFPQSEIDKLMHPTGLALPFFYLHEVGWINTTTGESLGLPGQTRRPQQPHNQTQRREISSQQRHRRR